MSEKKYRRSERKVLQYKKIIARKGVTMRNIININENWKFIREDAGLPEAYPESWLNVDLPHTWNAVDGNDGGGSYYRGKCWYAKTFFTPRTPTSPSTAACTGM